MSFPTPCPLESEVWTLLVPPSHPPSLPLPLLPPLQASVPPLISSLESALHRCVAFTGGVETEALLSALDDSLSLFTTRLTDCLSSLPTLCGVLPPPSLKPTKPGAASATHPPNAQGALTPSDASGTGVPAPGAPPLPGVEEEEEWAVVQGALQLLIVADRLATRAAVFEASLRAGLGQVGEQLGLAGGSEGGEKGGGGGGETDIARLRLKAAPERAHRLAR